MNTLAFILYAVVITIIFMAWRSANRPLEDKDGIVFKDPRVPMPGDRLADFRIKRARLVDPQRPEGNEVAWKFCRVNKPENCDHIYWAVMEKGEPIGQRCNLCGKFNSLEELKARWSREGLS